MRHTILSIIVFICLAKNNVTAQYWSAVGKGIGFLNTVQISEGFTDGYDAPVTGPPVASLCEYKGELYAGGFFDHLPDTGGYATNVAKWNGSKWQPIPGSYTAGGGGFDSWVNALLVYKGELYVAGRFTNVGNIEANNIAKWNGTEWSAAGAGLGTYGYSVRSLAIYNGELYAGGHFYNSGGLPLKNIAKWNGTEWSAVGTGITVYTGDYFSGSVSSLAVYNGLLYAGGSFDSAGSNRANNIAKWDGTNWSPVGAGIASEVNDYGSLAFVNSLTVHDGALYAGGDFDTAGGIQVKNIAKWDEFNWTSLASGIDGYVTSLSSYNGHLIVGGFFDTVVNVEGNCIAKWNGINWSSLGKGMDNGVSCLAALNGVLYAGGYFKNAGNIWANRVAKWSNQCNSGPTKPEQITGSGIACKNQYVVYVLNPVTDASDFTWTLPPGWTGNSISNRIVVRTGMDDGTISVTANNPCGSSIAQTISITLRDTVPFQLTTINGNNSVCQGSIQTYFIDPVPEATNYWWILPTGWTGHSTTNSITTTTGTNGGTISVRARNSCSSSNAHTLTVAVNVNPSQPLTGEIAGEIYVYIGQSTQYFINGSSAVADYNWSLSGGGIITNGQSSNSIFIKWQTAGTYILNVSSNNNCGVSSNKTITIKVTSPIAQNVPFELELFPNPSSGEFFLKVKGMQNKLIKVEIMNVMGQRICQNVQMTGTNDYSQLINLNKMAPGIYAVKVLIDDKVYTKQVLIIH